MNIKKIAFITILSAFCFGQVAAAGYFDWWFKASALRKGMYILLAASTLALAKHWMSTKTKHNSKEKFFKTNRADLNDLNITDYTALNTEELNKQFLELWIVQVYDSDRDKQEVQKLFVENTYALTGTTNSTSTNILEKENIKTCVVRNKLIDNNNTQSSQLIGFVSVCIENNALFIKCVCVAAKYRRKGIGKSLLAYVMDDAILANHKIVKVVVPRENSKAREFFAKAKATYKNLEIM